MEVVEGLTHLVTSQAGPLSLITFESEARKEYCLEAQMIPWIERLHRTSNG